MLSFDLRTVTFTYSPGYNAAITYTPQDDSYQVSFSADEGDNPHNLLAGLLSHRLNELTGGLKAGPQTPSTGQRFISVSVHSSLHGGGTDVTAVVRNSAFIAGNRRGHGFGRSARPVRPIRHRIPSGLGRPECSAIHRRFLRYRWTDLGPGWKLKGRSIMRSVDANPRMDRYHHQGFRVFKERSFRLT